MTQLYYRFNESALAGLYSWLCHLALACQRKKEADMARDVSKYFGIQGRAFFVILALGAALLATTIPTQNRVSLTLTKESNGNASAPLSVVPPSRSQSR
jgi:hypothetical protein